jgi:DNA-binding transcriptional ArsR family regulator
MPRNHKAAKPFDPVPVFSALADHTRLSLLTRLGDGAVHSIVELAANTNLTRQAVTKHLRVLEGAGLVQSEKVGRESQFTLRPDALRPVSSYLEAVSLQWDNALARLRDFVER